MSVKVAHSVVAKCKPEHAWQKFSNMNEWPWWNRAVGSAKWTDGQPWQLGSRFNLEIAYPKTLALKSVMTETATPQAIAWHSVGSGISGTMRFAFEPQGDTTVLKSEAELSGWKATFGASALQQAMQKTCEEWLDALKTEAEKIAREEFARS